MTEQDIIIFFKSGKVWLVVGVLCLLEWLGELRQKRQKEILKTLFKTKQEKDSMKKYMIIVGLIVLTGCSSNTKVVTMPNVIKDTGDYTNIIKRTIDDNKHYKTMLIKCIEDTEQLYPWRFPSDKFKIEFCQMVFVELAGITIDFAKASNEYYSRAMNIKRFHEMSDVEFSNMIMSKGEQDYYKARNIHKFDRSPAQAVETFDLKDNNNLFLLGVIHSGYNRMKHDTKYYELFQ